MKYKEFLDWCNQRASDGCWGLIEAIICANACKDLYSIPFWKRKKKWNEIGPELIDKIVNPTNKLIEERMKNE